MANPRNSPPVNLAVLYQALAPPSLDGLRKPPKPGGYADSGADIAFVLRREGVGVVTPSDHPDDRIELDWVFPDTAEGIAQAVGSGANVLWANTVLFGGHPLEQWLGRVGIVGQRPRDVERFDDKWSTNRWLQGSGLPIVRSRLAGASGASIAELAEAGLDFPLVVKPIRGRGSQGVSLAAGHAALQRACSALQDQGIYGNRFMLEEYLEGEELTVTVMPPGRYAIRGTRRDLPEHWSLPPVRRFNHQDGVAPYNGAVAVIRNSEVLDADRRREPPVRQLLRDCERAARLVDAAAPIRIDCRAHPGSGYQLFDLNMKPNMTGPGRPGREEHDSLSSLAARAIGWSYADLLKNMLEQSWMDNGSYGNLRPSEIRK